MNLFTIFKRLFSSRNFQNLFPSHKSLVTNHYSQLGLAPLVIIVVVALIAAAVPTTIILVQQEQDIRQNAQTSTGNICNGTAIYQGDKFIKDCFNNLPPKVCIETNGRAKCVAPTPTTTESAGNICKGTAIYQGDKFIKDCFNEGKVCSDNNGNAACVDAQKCRGTAIYEGDKFIRDCNNNFPPKVCIEANGRAGCETPKSGVINPTPTTGQSIEIEADGTITLKVKSNGVAYDKVSIAVNLPQPGQVQWLFFKYFPYSSSDTYVLTLPKSKWSTLNTYRFTGTVYFPGGARSDWVDSKVVGTNIRVSIEIDLPPNGASPTATPSQNGQEGVQPQPTATPRPIEWCRTDGDQVAGQGCCSNASCQPGLSCTGTPVAGGLKCCPTNTFWDGTTCAGASCQSLSFSCVPGSTKANETCCSPQFACDPIGQRCIVNSAPTPTPIPNATATPIPTRPVVPPPPTINPNDNCSAFGGQNGCTAWCQRDGGGGLNSYCDATCSSCLTVADGAPSPTVANNCSAFGSYANCNNWCRSVQIGANGCNSDCNGCY